MHYAFVRINKEKMSKSLGNFFTLREVFEQFDTMVVRFYFLNHHYRAPLDFSFDDLTVAKKNYQKLSKLFDIPASESKKLTAKNVTSDVVLQMVDYLADDFNLSVMRDALFDRFRGVGRPRPGSALHQVRAYMAPTA